MVKNKTEIKEIKVKGLDSKFMGEEPAFAETDEINSAKLGAALNWYNYFCDSKAAKEFIVQYLEINQLDDDIKIIKRISDSAIKNTYGWLCRCVVRGYKPTPEQQFRLQQEIERLKSLLQPDSPEDTVVLPARQNIQEIMKNRTLEVGGELEAAWDQYLLDGAKKAHQFKAIDLLTQRNILPQHVPLLILAWQSKLDEYQEVLSGKDPQLNEAYARFTKTQVKNIVDVLQTLIAEFNSYVSIKKTNRKPRASRPVSVEKIVKKLKFLKSFKLDKLELESISPTKLHNCGEAWVYDTKKRKLHHYVADEYGKTMSVKGNTLVGFCTKNSEIKALRKPETQIKEIMGSKPTARKFFDSIKATPVTPNGRFNEHMIILRAF